MSLIPKDNYKTEIIIKKSKFIGIGYPISSVDEAREILRCLKIEYSDSRHICYGFLWGKSSTHMGMSDDGEPHGTAGMPILEVLKGSGYENMLVAVIRYFGGIKLGTGGLVKAYTEIAQLVVKGIEVEEFIERIEVRITTPYSMYNQIKILLNEMSCVIINENFETNIDIKFLLGSKDESDFNVRLNDISNGELKIYKI